VVAATPDKALDESPVKPQQPPERDLASLVDKLREAGVHTVIYGLGSVLQTALGLILLPLYTKSFSPDVYGVFSLVTLTATVAGAVFYLGASSAMSRSYYDYADPEDRRMVVGTALLLSVIGAGTQIVLGVLIAGPLSTALFATDAYRAPLIVALVTSAITFINNLFLVVLRFQRRSKAIVTLNLTTLVLSTGLIYWLLVRKQMGIMGPLLGLLIGQAFQLIMMTFMARGSWAFRLTRQELRSQIAFGIPSLTAGLAYYVLDSVDRVFIAHMGTLDDVGVYSLGYRIAMVIHVVLVLPFSQIWAPMRMEYQNHRDARRFFSLVLTYYFVIGSMMTLILCLFAPEVVRVLAKRPEYLPAWRVIPLVMLGHLIYGAINIVDYGIVLSRRMFFHVWGLLLALGLNIGLNLVLIPRFGYMGAATATLLSYAALFAAIVTVSTRLHVIPWQWDRIGRVMALVLPLLAVGLTAGSSASGILLKLATVTVSVFLFHRLVLQQWERDQVARALNAFRR
jgi:O-antigen/teichoic acid export membrane protein